MVIFNQIKSYEKKIEKTHVVENNLPLLQKKFHYMLVTIKELQNMNVFSIQDLMGKLQTHKERSMRFNKMWVYKYFFQCKIVLDISKGLRT